MDPPSLLSLPRIVPPTSTSLAIPSRYLALDSLLLPNPRYTTNQLWISLFLRTDAVLRLTGANLTAPVLRFETIR